MAEEKNNLIVAEVETKQPIIYTGISHAVAYDASAKKVLKKKKDWEKERARDNEPITGRFFYNECKGGSLTFTYYKYKGDPVRTFTLVDGMEYTLPRGVVHHLNNNCGRPVHEYAEDGDGKRIMRIGYVEHRCFFQPSDAYANQDVIPAKLYTASIEAER